MTTAVAIRSALRERPRSGETRSGDRALVVSHGAGRALLAVIDALGHGEVAHGIAERAATAVSRLAAPTVEEAVEAMHAALKGTRGAGALVCTVHDGRVRAGGVGNVEMRTDGIKLSVALTPGILGVQRSRLQVFDGVVRGPARIALFSDGVAPRLDLRAVSRLPLDEAADDLFRRHSVSFDDATLLLVEV